MYPLDSVIREDAIGTTEVFPRGHCGRKSESVSTNNTLSTAYMEKIWSDCLHKCSAVPLTVCEITMMGYQTTTNHSNQLYSVLFNANQLYSLHLCDYINSSDEAEENHRP